MKLLDFLQKYVDHNAIIRIVIKSNGGHTTLGWNWNTVSMCHRVLSGKCENFSHLLNRDVINVTSILVETSPLHYPETVNIVVDGPIKLSEAELVEWESKRDLIKEIGAGVGELIENSGVSNG